VVAGAALIREYRLAAHLCLVSCAAVTLPEEEEFTKAITTQKEADVLMLSV
jgi:hypothetical protein